MILSKIKQSNFPQTREKHMNHVNRSNTCDLEYTVTVIKSYTVRYSGPFFLSTSALGLRLQQFFQDTTSKLSSDHTVNCSFFVYRKSKMSTIKIKLVIFTLMYK